MQQMPYQYFDLRVAAEGAPFAEGLKEKKLLLQRCRDCGHIRLPHAVICPECLSDAYDWVPATGLGEVYSFVVFHRAFHPAVELCLPYIVAQIQLQEGPICITNIVNCRADMVYYKQKVKLIWEQIAGERYIPVFVPSDRDDG